VVGHHLRLAVGERLDVTLTSDEIAAVINAARKFWRCAVRVQITAGYGCTVLEIFERDVTMPTVPLRRILL